MIARATAIFSIVGMLVSILLAYNSAPGAIAPASRWYSASAFILIVSVTLDHRRAALSLVYSVFLAIFFALPVPFQIASGRFPWESVHSGEQLSAGFMIMVAGHVAIESGFQTALLFRRSAPSYPAGSKAFHVPLLKHRALLWLFSLMLVTLMPVIGLDVLFSPRGSDAKEALTSTAALAQVGDTARSVSLVVLVLAITLYKRGEKGSVPALGLLSSATIIALCYNNPFANARYVSIGAAFAIMAASMNFRHKSIKIVTATIMVFSSIYAFDALKSLSVSGSLASASYSKGWLALDYDPLQWIVNSYAYFEANDLRWGNNFLGVALFFVPRAIWPSKPIASGDLVAGYLKYPYTNVSSPLQAEALIAFGLTGVLLIGALYGYALAAVEHKATTQTNKFRPLTAAEVYYPVLAGFTPIILRGALNATAQQYGSALLFSFLYVRITSVGSTASYRTERRGVVAADSAALKDHT